MLIALVELAKWWINLILRTTICDSGFLGVLLENLNLFAFGLIVRTGGLALKAPKFWFPCIGSQDLNIKTTDHDANTIITNQQFTTAGRFKKNDQTTTSLHNGTQAEHDPAFATEGRRLRKGMNDQTTLANQIVFHRLQHMLNYRINLNHTQFLSRCTHTY